METPNKTLKLTNCHLIRNGKIICEDLWIRNGKIINPEPIFYAEKLQPNKIVDCKTLLIVPGFIDVQINGAFGWDFSSNISQIKEAIADVRIKILASGVTAFCPTIVTSPESVYHELLETVKRIPGNIDGAEVLGIHLEGPFINPSKKGAHPRVHIKTLEKGYETLLSTYGNLNSVSLVTLAPELPNVDLVVKKLTTQNIVVSLGHSEGSLIDGERAAQHGASFITHLFNAMLPFHHRDPGLVGLLTSQFIPHDMYYGIIADGIHTHPAALRIAYRTHPEGLVLVTDAMAALGLDEGIHQLGQLDVEVCGKKVLLPGTSTLAGAIAPMDECIRHFIKSARVDIVNGIEVATLHPARLLNIEKRKGTLNFGSDADFVILETTSEGGIKVIRTYISGECVYNLTENRYFDNIEIS